MDDVDEATERNQRRVEEGIAKARSQPLLPGYPGVCSYCGEESLRLVLGGCAACRDKRGLE